MQKTARGFTLIETILYIGLFVLMAGAVLNFVWNTLDLSGKDRSARAAYAEARLVSMRLNGLIREASGIDAAESVFDDPNGKLVLEQLGTSDTLTIDLQGSRVMLTETGQSAVPLQSSQTETTSLTFTQAGTEADQSEYAGYELGLRSIGYDGKRASYRAETGFSSGAFLRNSGL